MVSTVQSSNECTSTQLSASASTTLWKTLKATHSKQHKESGDETKRHKENRTRTSGTQCLTRSPTSPAENTDTPVKRKEERPQEQAVPKSQGATFPRKKASRERNKLFSGKTRRRTPSDDGVIGTKAVVGCRGVPGGVGRH